MQVLPKVVTPTFFPAGGQIGLTDRIYMLTATVGAQIYYTLGDGGPDQPDPDEITGTLYTVSITTSTDIVIKAKAFKDGWTASDLAEVSYTLPPPPTATCGQTISVSTVLNADLDCSGYNGTALTIGANGITLDGGGHKLYVADGYYGVYSYGQSNVTINNLEITS